MKQPLSLRVNGEEREVVADPTNILLRVLRQDVGLTGTKEGCTTGACGACTVLLDGQAIYSCLMLAGSAQGHDVQTIEGLGSFDSMHPLQSAFVAEGAVQCGYCTPGMIMASAGLLNETAAPDETEIRAGLSGNLCRCTGYVKIVRAVQAGASAPGSGRP